jgi:S1-C subfamily serine protease
MTKIAWLGLASFGAVVLGTGVSALAAKAGKLQFGAKATWVLTEQNVTQSLLPSKAPPLDPAKTKTHAVKTRGNVEVFAKVAPAIVLVRTDSGHGSGFFVSKDGFIVTNHHVIGDGMSYDPASHASVAQVHFGKLTADGTMILNEEPVPAYFYKSDRGKDLALLKLARIPAELGAGVPSINLAAQAPRPAQSCAIVGHASSGMLWSYRPCAISAVGRDTDIVRSVVMRLAASGPARAEVENAAKAMPSRRTVVSSCGASPGDSGGPLVDEQGNLLAVTYAVPSEGVFDKFTYHVHLDEVRAFLADRPQKPTILTPDPWALGPQVELADLINEGKPQTLIAGMRRPTQVLFDLDGDTNLDTPLPALVGGRAFDAEVAIHLGDEDNPPRAFYDTDNDGSFDLIKEAGVRRRNQVEKIYRLGPDKTWDVSDARKDKEAWLAQKLPGAAGAKLTRLLARLAAN